MDRQGQDALDDLAKQTGGWPFIPGNQFELNASFELLAILLRNQYVIELDANPQPRDGKWRPVKIEVKLPPNAPSELKYPKVRHRAGYFDGPERQ